MTLPEESLALCVCGDPSCKIPYGYCHCQCNEKTTIYNRRPKKYRFGHRNRIRPTIEQAVPFKVDGVYCRLIPLTRGQYAIVNASDYEWLMQWKWRALWFPHVPGHYAVRTVGTRASGRKAIKMHRQILGLGSEDESPYGDHRNLTTIDNRRKNLRAATAAESARNRGVFKSNTSGYKGVTWHKRVGKWQARIGVNWKRIHLGYFDTPEEAYVAYCDASLKCHGKFSRTA